MRVLHIRSSNFFGGPERQILGHALAVARLGQEVIIGRLTSRGESGDFIERVSEHGVAVTCLDMPSAYDPRAIRKLRRWVNSMKPDLVCTHDYRSSILAALSGVKRDLPWIAFSRGLTREGMKVGAWQWLEQKLVRHADLIVAVSAGQAQVLRSHGIPSERIAVVHNAAMLPATGNPASDVDLRREFGFPADSTIVVAAGRFSEEKGQRDLIAAAKVALARELGLRFVLLGEGALLSDCRQLTEHLGIAGELKLPGFRRNIGDYLHQADIVVNPSLSEGLPNVVLEAMAHGKPVLATSVGGVPELIEDGMSGLLVPASDPGRLADGIQRLALDRDLQRRLGTAGLERVARHFTFEGQAEQLLSVYSSVLDAWRRRS